MVRQLLAEEPKGPMKIGACDWSLRCGHNPKGFEVAKAIGLDGVEVSFNGGDKFDLRDEKVRKQYRKAAEASGVEVCSLAMGVLNRVPYATSPEAERWVRESVDVAAKMDVKIVLLAFFSGGDIKGKKDLQDAVIGRLKKVAPKAEEAGVVLGIETSLDADAHLRIVDGVDSPAVKVYYDLANMTYAGYDVPKEIRRLGREQFCQINMKENGHLLGGG
jgi:L-ribulose-5-phosphate 3-epimerase